MDYTYFFSDDKDKRAIVGVIGATRGFGYTLLAQILKVPQIRLRVICSRHTDECYDVLKEIGYPTENIVTCADKAQIDAAPTDAILIVADYHLVPECGITSLVECTGSTGLSSEIARIALEKGINVYMVSKETDSVCGPALNRLAEENNAVYALVNGDQPRNIVDLYSWAKLSGLDVVAAGKASEFDFVWDRDTCMFSCSDGSTEDEYLPEMKDCWHYEGPQTLKERARLLGDHVESISADLCEMNLVSNITGLTAATPTLDYPIAKASELANIFIPKEDGGILDKTGVVDVFICLRDKDEASFAGGEFLIVRCENPKMWDTLAGKGHVMSRDNKYCCIYNPYHYMGLETPLSILLGDMKGIGSHPECRQVSALAAVASRDLKKGTKLVISGHHHDIDGTTPRLLEIADVGSVAPYYLLDGTVLLNDVKEGDPITTDDVDLSGLPIYDLYMEGLNLDEPSV